jgi:cobalt-zinc-cadmium resistance protein CzcA
MIITFDDNATDYFARQQVLERLQTIDLPPGVQPQLAPMSTAIGEIRSIDMKSKETVLVPPIFEPHRTGPSAAT